MVELKASNNNIKVWGHYELRHLAVTKVDFYPVLQLPGAGWLVRLQ